MHHNIKRLHHWALKHIFRCLVIQGPTHHANVAEVIRLLALASDKEFNEDNNATQYDFLRGRFEEAMDATFKFHGKMREVYKYGSDGLRPEELNLGYNRFPVYKEIYID